jgi:uncharacterized protein YajQ (UPF0234 family)
MPAAPFLSRGLLTVADSHSFDVVSEINHAEMHNAIVQAQHEIAVRFDFKGTHASIEFDKKENTVKVEADHKGQLDTVVQIVKEKMARRNVPGERCGAARSKMPPTIRCAKPSPFIRALKPTMPAR